jgi:hypothetical protein
MLTPKSAFVVLGFTLIAVLQVEAAKSLRVYFIGNSLTMSTTLDRVHQLVGQQGIALEFGSQVSGGKSLIRHKNYREEPDQKWKSWETNVREGGRWLPDQNMYVDDPGEIHRFGLYDEALPGHPWDIAVFQLSRGPLPADLEAISTFIDLAQSNKRPPQSYLLYSTWPVRSPMVSDGDSSQFQLIDYGDVWQADYAAGAEAGDRSSPRQDNASRAYVDQIYSALKKRYPTLNIRVLPVGEIFFVLDQKIREGKLPGLLELAQRDPAMLPGLSGELASSAGINLLYADGIHLNPVPHRSNSLGIFVSGTSLATALTGRSPVGLSAAIYGLDDAADRALIEAMQKTIWEVLQNDPRSGL